MINNTAWANYNGLQLNVTTRNFHGLTGTFAYTYSKALDNATDAFRSTGAGGSSIAFPQNPLDPNVPERGVSGNDFPNVIGLGFLYDFPQTQRKSGLLSKLINGYVLDSVYRYDSGQAYTFYQPIGLDAFTPDISYGDAAFNGDFNVGVGVDTSRLVLSNKKAPLNTVAYYNPYTGPTVDGNPTSARPSSSPTKATSSITTATTIPARPWIRHQRTGSSTIRPTHSWSAIHTQDRAAHQSRRLLQRARCDHHQKHANH